MTTTASLFIFSVLRGKVTLGFRNLRSHVYGWDTGTEAHFGSFAEHPPLRVTVWPIAVDPRFAVDARRGVARREVNFRRYHRSSLDGRSFTHLALDFSPTVIELLRPHRQ